MDFDKVQKSLLAVVALIGVVTYFLERYEDRQREARQASIRLIDEYTSEPFRDYREELSEFWLYHSADLTPEQARNLNEREALAFYVYSIQSYPRQAEFLSSVIGISEIFQKMAICSNTNICDSEILKSYLCGEFISFEEQYIHVQQILSERILTHPEFKPSMNWIEFCE